MGAMRILLCLEYEGTAYAGWQRQKNALSVQQVLEEGLRRLLGRDTPVCGAGRTDAGVHALGQAAHFDTRASIPPDRYAHALNALLPPDIRVTRSLEVPEAFHARFSAHRKEYRYYLYCAEQPSALFASRVWHVRGPLDLGAMADAAARFVGRHDFAAFQAAGAAVRDTVRTVESAAVRSGAGTIEIAVAGEGFLYNMVRILAGTLERVGAGALAPECVTRALASGNRLDLGPTAPARGLYLWNITYEGLETRRIAPFFG